MQIYVDYTSGKIYVRDPKNEGGWIGAKETVTTLTKDASDNGQYVYTSEDNTVTTIDVVGDVIHNASEIFQNTEVKQFITEIAGNVEGNVTYNAATNEFSYTDVAGDTHVVDLRELTKVNIEGGSNVIITGTGTATDAYIVNAVVPQQVVKEFVPSNGQTIFDLTDTPSSLSQVVMYVNGVRINKNAFSVSGTTVIYTPANNANMVLGLDQINNDNVMFDYLK
ncbi:hypothetical protein D3C86_1110170 [compost metagenome]